MTGLFMAVSPGKLPNGPALSKARSAVSKLHHQAIHMNRLMVKWL
jgi:hypothetical protein